MIDYTPKVKKQEYKPFSKTGGRLGSATKSVVVSEPYVRETPKYPSLSTPGGDTALKDAPLYTGTAMKGIGTLHKSNAVPVFTDEEAKSISSMRR